MKTTHDKQLPNPMRFSQNDRSTELKTELQLKKIVRLVLDANRIFVNAVKTKTTM